MTKLRSVMGSAAAAALLATSVTPAMAQGYPGYGYGKGWNHGGKRYRHHHRERGIDAGDVIAGVAIIGVIAAIAAAASKTKRNNDGYRGNINDENSAADACAIRAEQRFGQGTRAQVYDVVRTRDGYDVRGTLETNDRDRDRSDQRFTCSVRYGQVEDLRIDSGYAYQGY
ncbi:MAG: hypothetical protein ACKVOP_00255 [Sphingomonadaceae bacterium]